MNWLSVQIGIKDRILEEGWDECTYKDVLDLMDYSYEVTYNDRLNVSHALRLAGFRYNRSKRRWINLRSYGLEI